MVIHRTRYGSLESISHYNHLPHCKAWSHLHTIKDGYSRGLQFISAVNYISVIGADENLTSFVLRSYIMTCASLCLYKSGRAFSETYTHTPHCTVANPISKQMY